MVSLQGHDFDHEPPFFGKGKLADVVNFTG
jgi:hypothetical protein